MPVVGSAAPEDAFMEHVLVGMAEFYSKNLAREIKKDLTSSGNDHRIHGDTDQASSATGK